MSHSCLAAGNMLFLGVSMPSAMFPLGGPCPERGTCPEGGSVLKVLCPGGVLHPREVSVLRGHCPHGISVLSGVSVLGGLHHDGVTVLRGLCHEDGFCLCEGDLCEVGRGVSVKGTETPHDH